MYICISLYAHTYSSNIYMLEIEIEKDCCQNVFKLKMTVYSVLINIYISISIYIYIYIYISIYLYLSIYIYIYIYIYLLAVRHLL